jgi:SAM-dependent methyltransferase
MPSDVASGSIQLPLERVDEARLLIRHEFAGLDAHQQYYNAFSRLLKWDPLRRVTMLGTDQRDQFVPLIRQALSNLPRKPAAILDVGCGDGATFDLFADVVPPGSLIDLIDPNADYVAAYKSRTLLRNNIKVRNCHVAGFVPDPTDTGYSPKLSRDYNVIFCLHSVYFFDDLSKAVRDLYARLSPGGIIIIVFADETVAYTGVCHRLFLERSDSDKAAADASLCDQRLRLFGGTPSVVEPGVSRLLAGARVAALRQDTRLFGHSIADLVALSNIAGLADHGGIEKFEAALGLLATDAGRVSFRIETDATTPRFGMMSVQQPQVVCSIQKPLHDSTE